MIRVYRQAGGLNVPLYFLTKMAQKKHGKNNANIAERSKKMGRLFSRVLCGDISPPSILVALPECDRSLSQSEAENGPRAACERASEPTHSGPPRVGRARRPPVGGLRPGRPATSQLTAGFLTFPRCLLRVVSSTRVDDCGGVQGFQTHPWLPSESSALESYVIFRGRGAF